MLVFTDDARDRLGVMQIETRQIEWHELEPHSVLNASRPRWLSDEEVVLTVAAHGLERDSSPLWLKLDDDDMLLLGGLDLSASWVEPTEEENVFYVATYFWDPESQTMPYSIAKIRFYGREVRP